MPYQNCFITVNFCTRLTYVGFGSFIAPLWKHTAATAHRISLLLNNVYMKLQRCVGAALHISIYSKRGLKLTPRNKHQMCIPFKGCVFFLYLHASPQKQEQFIPKCGIFRPRTTEARNDHTIFVFLTSGGKVEDFRKMIYI